MGVSTTPVREAFQILARDGLIKLRPNKGAVVQGINEKTIGITESRPSWTGGRGQGSAEGVDLSAVDQAYQIAEKALEDNDSAEYSRYNQAFHMGIWEAADNEKMKSLLSSMWNGLSMGPKGDGRGLFQDFHLRAQEDSRRHEGPRRQPPES